MKILIDPTLAILARDLSTEDKAELLMCILEYPNRDCALGLWKYMRQQIDVDARKYKEKCERMAEVGKKRWGNPKSDSVSDTNSDLFSAVKKEESKENIIKENCNCKESVSSNAAGIVEKPVDNFLISSEFSLDGLCWQVPKLSEYLAIYLPAVVERAGRTLVKKRLGQRLALAEILDWIHQESVFYKQNHGGAQ